MPLIAGGGVLAAGAVALSLGVFTGSGKGDAVLLDPRPSAPAISVAPVGPSDGPTGETASPSASASHSASASASRSASPSAASPTASRSSSPAPAPSATTGRPAGPTTPPPAPKPVTLRSGDSGPEVEKLQRLLADQGLYRGRFDGRYGHSVERAVDDFQFYNDVEGDPPGVYGPATRRALEG